MAFNKRVDTTLDDNVDVCVDVVMTDANDEDEFDVEILCCVVACNGDDNGCAAALTVSFADFRSFAEYVFVADSLVVAFDCRSLIDSCVCSSGVCTCCCCCCCGCRALNSDIGDHKYVLYFRAIAATSASAEISLFWNKKNRNKLKRKK